VASLFAPASSWAADEDEFVWKGSVEVGGRGVNTDATSRNGARATSATASVPFTGPEDGAKAQEYQDLNSGVIGVVDMRGSSRNYYLKFFGENFGRDDQYINLVGGGYGVFKGQIYNDRIPHNLSWNAITPLANTGSNLQVGPGGTYPPAQNPATWNTFDYGIQRNTTGANVEVSNNSPFFFRADYNEVLTTGVRPGSGVLGTGSGNGMIELGIPVDYKTQNTVLDAGYATKTWNAKLGFLWSKFTDGGEPVQWTNFYMLNKLDTTLLPQDNDLKKWSFNANVRDLPLDSTLMLRLTQSKLTSSFAVPGSGLKPTNNASPPIGSGYLVTAPSSSTFDGEHKTTSAAIAIASTLAKDLESRLYYNYYDRENNSTPISYATGGLGTTSATPCTTSTSNSATQFCIAAVPASENFAYKKNEFGLDLTWRLAKGQKLSGGYAYLKVDRELEPATETENNSLWIEYKNTMVENLTARAKYIYLERRSNLDHAFTNSGTATPAQVPYYFSAYDVSNNDQNTLRLWVDWAPMEMLDVSFGGTWRKTDYKDLQYYGRTDDKRQLYDLTVSYGSADTFRITALGNYGEVEFNQAYHQGTGPTPGGTQTPTDFDWGTKNTQSNWLYALEADWVATEKLKVKLSASWQKTGGGVDFWSGNTAGAGGFNGGPLVNYLTDNTKTQRLMIRGDYLINKNWTASAGYAYENYDYTDDQMRSYQSYYGYYQNLGGTNISWNTGAFAAPAYTNNIFFITGTYRFN
jgi:hypothetical protein